MQLFSNRVFNYYDNDSLTVVNGANLKTYTLFNIVTVRNVNIKTSLLDQL